MKIIIKWFLIPISTLLIILSLLLLLDMANYDNSFVNRQSLQFDVKNLNSRHSRKIISVIRDKYISLSIKLSENSLKRWSVESEDERKKYPKFKIIFAKKENFTESSTNNDVYKNYSNWLRSHGNNYANRFSGLKQININNVNELNLAWKYKSNDSLGKVIQANPVVQDGYIYTSTPGNNIVSIDGTNGKEVWRFKVKNGVAAKRGLLIWKSKSENFSRIFFTDNQQKLISLNSKTGKKITSFGKKGEIKIGLSPIPPLVIENYLIVATFNPDLQVYDVLTGRLLWKYYLKEPKNSIVFENFNGGNPWGGISSDNKRGIVYLTTGDPGPWYVGVDRPGDNLYANSVIAIDIKNKKKLWHFQEINHDIWNLDLGAPPILTSIKKNNLKIDVVVAVSKLGNVIILDRVTGEPIFDIVKKRAPTSKVPGEKTSIYQPDIKLPEPICRNKFIDEYITDIDDKNRDYIRTLIQDVNFGYPTPFEIGRKGIEIGNCVRWAGASVDTDNNSIFVSADQRPQLAEIKVNSKGKFKYYSKWTPFNDLDGYPGIKPPWGTLTSLNLSTGKINWQVPLGEYEELTKKGIAITGTKNRSGATATAGGLVFVSGTWDNKIRAFSSYDGKELWSYKLPSVGSAPPTSYMIKEKQYIIIPAFETLDNGDELLAFSIK